ncbi:MAG TPA: lipopolysaccharide kinase InaA family protein [Chthoniobacter sp.]|nr:lipopolysaccharide kinase InaA family protein [Chthoniobacter sp.]
MSWVAVNCPQCSAPLPRIAIWRSVKCPSCGALITRTESLVMRETFRQALLRARSGSGMAGGDIQCGGDSYQLGQLLGRGETSQVYLARRVGILPFVATIKLSSASDAPARYAREAQVLRELQALQSDGAGAYFSQLLPEAVAVGAVEGSNHAKCGLVLRYPNGFWGSLAALNERYAQGLDPRHTVWIWRRMLEVLNFIHAQGWSHGDIRPEHVLVHPQNHGARIIGWSSAQRGTGAKGQVADLLRSARVVLVLLSGAGGSSSIPSHVPAGLAQLVTRAGQDEDFCRGQGAQGLDALLRAEARAAFGPPAFVSLEI